jgi:ribosomal protein S18 acetylase RimI-like enzyme
MAAMTTRSPIRRLEPADATAYRALMLQAYESHPEAFTSSPAERAVLPLAWWTERLPEGPRPASVVYGAFDENAALVGAVGLVFESREKTRHKADLFGMYVAPAARQRGFGRQLVAAALAEARAREGLRVVQLTVTHGNDEALALYQGCGFQTFGVEPMAIGVGGRFLAKVHMWCDLAPPA